MQILIWIIIILVFILILWLLRRWIRRLIFIIVLLLLAFLIYGIFSPSGAARLWYNTRTFPQRVMSRFSSQSFLDYDSYKLDLPTIGNKIDSGMDNMNIDNIIDNNDESDDERKNDVIIIEKENDNSEILETEKEEQAIPETEKSQIKTFPKSIMFVKFPKLDETNMSEDYKIGTGSSVSDLIGQIDKYIEKNLDNDTNILVTVEYQEEGDSPSRIILQTQSGFQNGVSALGSGRGELLINYQLSGSGDEVDLVESNYQETQKPTVSTSSEKVSSNKLTKKDEEEAEEVFSILF